MPQTMEEFVEHFGTKGMRWGQRNAKSQKTVSAKKTAKLDKKWEKKAGSTNSYFKAYNDMAGKLNATEIDRINKKYEGKDTLKPGKLQDQYHAEFSKTATKILNDYAKTNIGPNASGTKEVKFDYDVMRDGMPVMRIVDVKKVKHDGFNTILDVKYDELGHILSVALPREAMHSAFVDDFLDHHGVKGMKWGKRKARNSTASTPTKKDNSFKKSSGDDIRSLNNKQLADKVQRMQLERQYNQLASSKAVKSKSKGREFVESIALNIVRTQIQNTANALIGRELNKRLGIKIPKNDN